NNINIYESREKFMQLTIQKKDLLESIQKVSAAISSRTAIPILTGMKMDVTTDGVVLTGSDSDITIQSHIHVEKNVGTNDEGQVHITVDEQYKTTIKSGKALFTLYGQSTSEYPQVEIHQHDDHINLPVKELKALIRQTVFAVSQMETRPILTGVHVKIDSETITFTATDSHRLALRSIKTNLHDFEETEIVIPGKSLQELNKMMDQNDEFIRIAILKNQVLFYTEDTYFL